MRFYFVCVCVWVCVDWVEGVLRVTAHAGCPFYASFALALALSAWRMAVVSLRGHTYSFEMPRLRNACPADGACLSLFAHQRGPPQSNRLDQRLRETISRVSSVSAVPMLSWMSRAPCVSRALAVRKVSGVLGVRAAPRIFAGCLGCAGSVGDLDPTRSQKLRGYPGGPRSPKFPDTPERLECRS